MRRLILATLIFLSVTSEAAQLENLKTDLSCTLSKLYDNSFFEELLSIEEYPNLIVKTAQEVACEMCPSFREVPKEIYIGAALFDGSNEEKMDMYLNDKFITVYSISNDSGYGPYRYEIEVRVIRSGKRVIRSAILTAEGEHGEPVNIALFDCK